MPTGISKNSRFRCRVTGCKYTAKSAGAVKQHRRKAHAQLKGARALSELPTTRVPVSRRTQRHQEGWNYCPVCGTNQRGWRHN